MKKVVIKSIKGDFLFEVEEKLAADYLAIAEAYRLPTEEEIKSLKASKKAKKEKADK